MSATRPTSAEPQQDTLLGLDDVAPARRRGPRAKAQVETNGVPIATTLPVARVVLDLQPAHLDQPYDYLVPATMTDDAQPGVRVKVRFGRQDVDGYVVARQETSDHDGRLVPLRRVVSAEPVLTPAVLALARAVADRYAGTLADVLRLAVPPRHAKVEKEAVPADDPTLAGSDGAAGSSALPGSGLPALAGSDAAAGDVVRRQPSAPRSSALPPGPSTPAHDIPGTTVLSVVSPSIPGTSTSVVSPSEPPPDVPGSTPSSDAPASAVGDASSVWASYRGGQAFLRRVLAREAPRAVWSALPGVDDVLPHWALAVGEAVRACVAGGRGALVVVPDARDVARVRSALDRAGLPDHVQLLADDGPAPRYRAFLSVLRGSVPVAVGTRAAMFAPVRDLGLVVLWGDGEDTLAEPHAPYPHARDVLALRAELEGAAYLLGSPGRTVQAQALLASGWARELAAPRDVVRARAPRVRALTSVELAREGAAAAARLPSAAWRAARDALGLGPVLVQVPRAGYLPVVACARCRTAARCSACHGPLGLSSADGAPQCTWCGRLAGHWSCDECGFTGLRSVRVGSERTAEELGRAFPGVPVRLSAASAPGGVLDTVGTQGGRHPLIVATPGAEPVAPGGYAAALLLDAAVLTAGTGLAVATEALHRWLAAASLVRSDGQVLLVGDAAPAPTQALVRFDPAGLADRELAERAQLDLPPAVRVAAVTGDRFAVDALVSRVDLADLQGVLLGPVEVPDAPDRPGAVGRSEPAGAGQRRPQGSPAGRAATLDAPVRAVLRVPLARGGELARRLHASLAVRSARREGGTARVQLDPKEML
ncbi:primosomal protein N' [Antribacter sp. KLBMP9083]|uniref:Probable replication restart protein PriA n=1 Tax=Antribacter soli TaxID=2910976 RepID=A0AA41QC66_9MICO|nr:primosomal protein N' [Antribacter soli]MCF4120760.1 primosomal protein N' [Antribacter soli]